MARFSEAEPSRSGSYCGPSSRNVSSDNSWFVSFLFAAESVDGAAPCEPSCPVLESDFLLNGELEFGSSEMAGLDRDGGGWRPLQTDSGLTVQS